MIRSFSETCSGILTLIAWRNQRLGPNCERLARRVERVKASVRSDQGYVPLRPGTSTAPLNFSTEKRKRVHNKEIPGG